MDSTYGMSDIENIRNMLGVEIDDADTHQFGSALNPGTVGREGDEKEEIAKPHSKIEFKVNNRAAGGGAKDIQAAPEEDRNKERDIWTDKEVNLQSTEMPDDRIEPEFDVLLKQEVGTEDVFLGLSEKDPSSNCCDGLCIKIKLPGHKLKDIQCDVKKQSIHVQTAAYVLNHTLPYPVDDQKGSAKWDSDKDTLILDLPAIKESLIDAFCKRPEGM
jgi:hypothetical protein